MRWDILHAATADAHSDYHRQIGREIPEHWEPPEIMAGFEGWYRDYFDLVTDRRTDMGPVPHESIIRHTAGWSEGEAVMFKHIVRALDQALSQAVKDSEEMAGLPPEPKEGRKNG